MHLHTLCMHIQYITYLHFLKIRSFKNDMCPIISFIIFFTYRNFSLCYFSGLISHTFFPYVFPLLLWANDALSTSVRLVTKIGVSTEFPIPTQSFLGTEKRIYGLDGWRPLASQKPGLVTITTTQICWLFTSGVKCFFLTHNQFVLVVATA